MHRIYALLPSANHPIISALHLRLSIPCNGFTTVTVLSAMHSYRITESLRNDYAQVASLGCPNAEHFFALPINADQCVSVVVKLPFLSHNILLVHVTVFI